MKLKRWFHRQSRGPRFFILWAIFAIALVGTEIGGSLTGAALVHAHVFHAPPWWVFVGDVLGTAVLAALRSKIADRRPGSFASR